MNYENLSSNAKFFFILKNLFFVIMKSDPIIKKITESEN
ncbi:hypothetical protein RT41_GL001070 [Lactococcus fujiensis JCM 16395]|uniref:Uncharacterized protein n=1 Tax=Lactococcus fujiensis JCM 16395 TaxID=1291764 RepID=A0A2A5RN03_9LACT|nr:hypothetical protein RT41_GL001070 [Lactococcus fujiensis JCM 16395]